jgi:hypothetical protein
MLCFCSQDSVLLAMSAGCGLGWEWYSNRHEIWGLARRFQNALALLRGRRDCLFSTFAVGITEEGNARKAAKEHMTDGLLWLNLCLSPMPGNPCFQ